MLFKRKRLKVKIDKPGELSLLGISLLGWAGLTLYYGTPELIDLLFDDSIISLTEESNPTGFWFSVIMLSIIGVSLIALDIIGFIHGYDKVGKAVTRKLFW